MNHRNSFRTLFSSASERAFPGFFGDIFGYSTLCKKRCPSTQEFTRFLSMVSSQRRAMRSDVITSVDHKGVTCYGIRGRGVESRSLMTSVETRDLSGKDDRYRVNSNFKRVGKSRHVDGGMFTTVAILNEKSFDQGSRLVFSSYMCLWWWVVRGTQRL